MTASICSTDDCIMLARVFNSAKASCETLRRRALSNTSTPTVTCGTYLAVEGWAVDVAGCEEKGVGSDTEKGISNDERRAALKGRYFIPFPTVVRRREYPLQTRA